MAEAINTMVRMKITFYLSVLTIVVIGLVPITGCSLRDGSQMENGWSGTDQTLISPTVPEFSNQKAVKETDFSLKEDEIILKNSEPVPSTKYYNGIRITVAAPPDRMSDLFHKDGQEWAERTGARLEVLEIPFSRIFEEVATDILSGNGLYDIISYPHYLSGDIMGTGKLVPLEKLIDVEKANLSYYAGGLEWNSYFSTYREIYCWYNGHIYSLPVDGDVFQVAYRKDLWIKYADEFKAIYNYELRPDDPVFPETWDQYYDIAEYFNGREGHYGTVDINARSRTSAWHFLTRYVSYLQKDGMYNGDIYFDKETMEPLINNPAGIKAMEDIIKSARNKYSPKGVEDCGWDDMQQAWHQGKTVIQFTWPAMYNIARRPGSAIPGGAASTGYSLIPGSKRVYDANAEKWIELTVPHRASMLAHGWQLSIVNSSMNKEAAFDLMKWMTTGNRLIHHSQKLYWEYEPVKEWQVNDAAIRQNFKDSPSYLESLKLNQKVGVPDLRIPGAVQMYDAIEIYKTQALEGKLTAREAVDAIAADWDKIVKQRGFEKMKEAYIDTITPRKLEDVRLTSGSDED